MNLFTLRDTGIGHLRFDMIGHVDGDLNKRADIKPEEDLLA